MIQLTFTHSHTFVCTVGVCVVYLGYVCVCLSELSCLHAWSSHREGVAVADHYRETDRGRSEFSGVCLRLGPLLNDECSILLIMLLWLMSLSADSGGRNETLLLSEILAFLIGLIKELSALLFLPFTFLGLNRILCFSFYCLCGLVFSNSRVLPVLPFIQTSTSSSACSFLCP